ncbi:aminoglycoside phosphotransferase family protein [Halomonas sp. BLK-85]
MEKLHKTSPGPTPSKTPEQKRIEALERENARLQQKLSTAEDCLSLQKKAFSMLDRLNNGSEP